MPYTPTTITSGTQADASDLITPTNQAFAYINRIPQGDIRFDTVITPHLFKPEAYGTPKNGVEGTFQAIFSDGRGLIDGGSLKPTGSPAHLSWAKRKERSSIFIPVVADKTPIPGLACSLYIPNNPNGELAFVKISCEFEYTTIYNYTVYATGGVGSESYPDAAGNGSLAGTFKLYRKTEGSPTLVGYPSTERQVYPLYYSLAGASRKQQALEMLAGDFLAYAKWYTFFVAYERGSTSANIKQLAIGLRSIRVDLFHSAT